MVLSARRQTGFFVDVDLGTLLAQSYDPPREFSTRFTRRTRSSRQQCMEAISKPSTNSHIKGNKPMSTTITIAPTGPIATKSDNPSLPTTPEEIAAAVTAGYEAGASVAHIHLRDEFQRPTADLAVGRRVLDAIAQQSPILIQMSTGVGLSVPFDDRERLIDLRPQMATLNPCSMSFGDGEFLNPPAGVKRLAAKMRDLGIKPELEIYDTGHLDACLHLRDLGLLPEPLQFSIVLGVRGGMAATAENLLNLVSKLPEGAIWQVIAIGRANLELTAIGLALGGNARAGLEDTLYMKKGVLSQGSTPLVERAVRLVKDLGRTVATVEETKENLGLTTAAYRENQPRGVSYAHE